MGTKVASGTENVLYLRLTPAFVVYYSAKVSELDNNVQFSVYNTEKKNRVSNNCISIKKFKAPAPKYAYFIRNKILEISFSVSFY